MNKGKGFKKAVLVFSVLILGTLGYTAYSAFYPNEKFYIKDFESNAAMVFPTSAVIIEKEATYPDIHGSYTSRAIIKLSASDYNTLYRRLRADNTFKVDTSSFHFLQETIDYFNSKNINSGKIQTVLIGVREAQFKIGFINDGRTIIFERHSS